MLLASLVLLSLNRLELHLEKSKAATGASGRLASKNRIKRPIAAILVFNTEANRQQASPELSGER